MSADLIQKKLDQVESSLEQLSLALREKDTLQLMSASNEVQRFAVELPKLMQQCRFSTDKATQQRMLRIVGLMGVRREALLRHAAITQCALSTLVPASQENATYTPAAGRFSRQPYGSVGRQSGEFKALTA